MGRAAADHPPERSRSGRHGQQVDVGDELVRSVAGLGQKEGFKLGVMAASVGLFDAVRSVLKTGRFFDAGHDQRGDKVVVLGKNAAKRLGINRVDSQPAIFIGDQAYTVIGILDSVSGQAELLDSVIMPNGTAKKAYDLRVTGLGRDPYRGRRRAADRRAGAGRDRPEQPECASRSTPRRSKAAYARAWSRT